MASDWTPQIQIAFSTRSIHPNRKEWEWDFRFCRTIIAAHGGQLTATANTGHGASFQFLLPVGAKAPRE